MKIIFSTGQIHLHGGIEKSLTEKANFFSEFPNTEVFIVTTEQKNKKPCYDLDQKVKIIDLAVNYDRNKSYFSINNLGKAIKHFFKQKRIFHQLKPDVVISPNYNFDHYWLPFLLSKRKTKIIKERHSSYYLKEQQRKTATFKQKIAFYLNDLIEKEYSHIVVLNEDEKKYVKTHNAVVIPNAVYIPDFKSEVINKKIIAAGRIAPVKAFDELIFIWKEVATEYPDWELHIYGDDYLDTKSGLEKQIEKFDLQQIVFFKEPVSNLQKTMQDYSLYVMTSLTECFPMVLLESLSVGLPIISYDCPNGPRNIITNNNDGVLIENMNRLAFSNAVKKLIIDSESRKLMSYNAKENANRFSTVIVSQLWAQLLNLKHV